MGPGNRYAMVGHRPATELDGAIADLGQDPPQPERDAPRRRHHEADDATALQVLLIEDDDQDARLLEALLTEDGLAREIRFTRATSLADACDQLRESQGFDAALLDLGLPDGVGLESYVRLAGRAPGLPVVVLSGDADHDLAVAAVREGAQDYLVKGRVTGDAVSRVLRYAVERSRVLARQRAQAERQELLLRLGRLALETADPEPFLEAATRALAEGLNADRAEVVEQVGGELRQRAGIGWRDPHVRRLTAGAGRASWEGYAAMLGRSVVVEDVTEETRFALGDLLETDPPASGLVVPVVTGPSLWGVVGAFLDEARRFTPDELAFASQLAGMVATTVRHMRTEADRVERVKELTALRGVARAVQEDLTRTQLAGRVADELQPSLRYPGSTVTVVELEGHRQVRPQGRDREMVVSISSDIVVAGERRGRVEVGYTERLAFLDEEREILDAVAESLSVWVGRHEAVQHLTASRQRLEMVLSQLPAIVYTVDEDLAVTSMSGQQVASLDHRRGTLVGARLPQLFDGRDCDGGDETVAAHEAALEGRASRFTLRVDGRWWDGLVEPLADTDGTIVGSVGLAVDDTDRRRDEEALADSKARLQALFDNTLDAILLADDDMRYVDANPAATRLLGYAHDELLDMTVSDLVPGSETLAHAEEYWEAFREDGDRSGRIALRRRDGGIVVAEYQAVNDIQPGLHLSVLRDVTARVRAEAAVRASEERFRQLAENASEGIVRVGVTDGRSYEYVNPAVARMTGFSEGEIMADGGLLEKQVHPGDRAIARQALDGQLTDPAQLRFERGDGRWIWLELHATPVLDPDDTVTAVQALVVDITDRKRQRKALEDALEREQRAAERLRRLDAMKDTFLQAVSHELRTPLASVYGYGLTLQRKHDVLSDEQRAHMTDRLVVNADKLRCLLDDLLDVNRLSAGAVELRAEPLDLAILALDVAGGVDMSDHRLEVDARSTPVLAEAGKLERIVCNLLDNAAKHTPTGTNVWLRTEPVEEGALLTVEDDGPGVPDDLKIEIFEAFRQGAESQHAASPGTGIGLNLVARFAELHDGRAWVEDRPGGGASFRVFLPDDAKRTPPVDE